MFKRYFHSRERYFAMLNDNRVVHPFEWGAELIVENLNGVDPHTALSELANEWVERSTDVFSSRSAISYELSAISYSGRAAGQLIWPSAIETPSPENNTARAHYFPNGKDRRAAIVILPHWNAKAGTYFDLAKIFNQLGMSALRMTLPYHEERMPPELERAEYLVAPNVGRTLQSVRQAVLDTRAAVHWLKEQGYEKIGLVGTSIGSCTGFLAFVHDPDIDAAVFNHVSGYFSDVVWNGLSTYHVRESLETAVTLEELRKLWMPISPMAYMPKLASQPWRPQRYIYTRCDLTFPYGLSLDTMAQLRSLNIKHDEVVLPCGHYTLGQKPWVWIDGWKIVSFLRRAL
ncbi:MAG: hypothetical protein JO314_00535 [Acidobacteria bacterium]|nr:hypothetical protein [Acidobacteriota bacterium]